MYMQMGRQTCHLLTGGSKTLASEKPRSLDESDIAVPASAR